MNLVAKSLFVPLNRPEYPRNPEAPLSALAWSLTALPHSHQPGKVYESLVKTKRAVMETRPTAEDWIPSLLSSGLEIPGGIDASIVASSLLDGIAGVRADKAHAVAAVPLVPNAAFLQNPVGMHSKDGPPNFAAIVEQVYAAGSAEAAPSNAAATMFMECLAHAEQQPVFRMLNKALRPQVIGDQFEGAPFEIAKGEMDTRWTAPPWFVSAPQPFRWFRNSWADFCQPLWRETLPRRRWSDWAACILRTGVGLSFLWEAEFFRQLGRAIHGGFGEDSFKLFLRGGAPLIEWKPASHSLGARDVNSRIIRVLIDGQAVRTRFLELLDEDRDWRKHAIRWRNAQDLDGFLRWAKGRGWGARFKDCYGRSRDSAANNLIETVVYLLQTRQSLGADADFYGFLARRKKRFVVVEPGMEWIVVIAGIAARRPGLYTNLGTVRDALRLLGIGAGRDVIVAELERAGLARGSYDADDAIVVQPGF